MPPPHTNDVARTEEPDTAFDGVASLNEQQCREALIIWTRQNVLLGKECAEEMTIQQIQPSRDLHVSVCSWA